MDQYIREFTVDTVQTYSLDYISECTEILKVNDSNFNIKILNTNIRSISRNYDEFKVFLYNLDTSVDCIILTETREVLDTNLFTISGYCCCEVNI